MKKRIQMTDALEQKINCIVFHSRIFIAVHLKMNGDIHIVTSTS